MTKGISLATILFLFAVTTTMVIAQSNAKDAKQSACSMASGIACPASAILTAGPATCTAEKSTLAKSSCPASATCDQPVQAVASVSVECEPCVKADCADAKACDTVADCPKVCDKAATLAAKSDCAAPCETKLVASVSVECEPCVKADCADAKACDTVADCPKVCDKAATLAAKSDCAAPCESKAVAEVE